MYRLYQNNDTDDIGNINPFRWKGHYYDTESELYYLQTRYYDPAIGQFIQPAKISSLQPYYINKLNLYSCGNNLNLRESSLGQGVRRIGQNSLHFIWPNFDFLGTGFGYIENTFSMISGVIEGIRKIKHLDSLAGLDKASKWLMGIGIGINLGLSIYNNLTDSNLTGDQKAGNIFGDGIYIGLSSVATWGVSALTAMIPVVGPFIAPILGFGFGTGFDQFWHGENIFGIDGFNFNPGGKSIDEWIKDFLAFLFGG